MLHSYSHVLLISLLGKRCVNTAELKLRLQQETKTPELLEKYFLNMSTYTV